jgi:hypothetical protein
VGVWSPGEVRTSPLWQWRIKSCRAVLTLSMNERQEPTAERVSNCSERETETERGCERSSFLAGLAYVAHRSRDDIVRLETGRAAVVGASDLVHLELALLVIAPLLLVLLLVLVRREDGVLHQTGHVGEDLCSHLSQGGEGEAGREGGATSTTSKY